MNGGYGDATGCVFHRFSTFSGVPDTGNNTRFRNNIREGSTGRRIPVHRRTGNLKKWKRADRFFLAGLDMLLNFVPDVFHS
jgi:hypothetical protein